MVEGTLTRVIVGHAVERAATYPTSACVTQRRGQVWEMARTIAISDLPGGEAVTSALGIRQRVAAQLGPARTEGD
jgi:hypothetical protein